VDKQSLWSKPRNSPVKERGRNSTKSRVPTQTRRSTPKSTQPSTRRNPHQRLIHRVRKVNHFPLSPPKSLTAVDELPTRSSLPATTD